LSDWITAADASRAVKTLDVCLRGIAYDSKTGTFDIDCIATGTPKKAMDITVLITQTIQRLISDKNTAAPSEVIELVSEQGYDKWRVEKQYDAMLRAGKLTEPRAGIVKVVY
jgi:DNA replicative helicase MCM subunit Mcm2 (Cdc46/Mcm family)